MNNITADDFCFGTGVVALTGGIGSGKSSVGRWLSENAAYAYINADNIVASLLEVNAIGWLGLRSILKPEFFLTNGEIDKASLRLAIFSDADLRSAVEGILHPLVFEKIKVAALEAGNKDLRCLVEVPLLYEVGWQRHFKTVIVVYASNDVCAARIQKRDGVSYENAKAGINSQKPLKGKAIMADHVIENTGLWAATVVQLNKLQKKLDTSMPIS
jgi:dephospho-CoA kinase